MDAVGEEERVAIKVLNVRKLAVPTFPLMRKKTVRYQICIKSSICSHRAAIEPEGGGGGVLWLMFAGYVPLASQSPCPIIVYFLANYRPHPSHFLENVIFAIPT